MYRAKPPSPVWAPGKLNPANPGKGRSPIAGFWFHAVFLRPASSCPSGSAAQGIFYCSERGGLI